MFAILRTGGKQYRVAKASIIDVERLEANVSETLTIGSVLCVGSDGDASKTVIGSPLVEGASVEVKVLDHGRHDKVYNFKKRRRKNSQRLRGHRQSYTRLEVLDIVTQASK